MIATIGTFLFWVVVIAGGATAVICAFIGFMVLINYRR
nr:MAG TPA_asm: hypothetical protein [Caudoviricetes sp.]